MIQAIVYDAVGTLIHVKPSVAALYAECGRRFGSHRSEDEIRDRFLLAFARQDKLDEQAEWRTSEERERQRWRAIVAEVLDDVADFEGCFETLFRIFGEAHSWVCAPEAGEVMAVLQKKGYRQAMASNFDRRLRSVIADMPFRDALEHLVISSEVGWRKPAEKFFAHVAETLRLPPDAILFVGDDFTNDYQAAQKAGMKALLLDPRKQRADLADPCLENLAALLPLW